jgi:arylformamidase
MDENTPLYGGGKGVLVKSERSINNGDTANTKILSLHNHSGTHIDFPNHFFANGNTSEMYDAAYWIFSEPFMIKIETNEDQIITCSEEQLNSIPPKTDFLILKTGFGKFRNEEKYWKNNPGLSPELADQLRKKVPMLRVIGLDLISITSFMNREIGRKAHREFLKSENPILLVEDMDLSQLDSNPKSIICMPLLIKGLDGSPVTIIAKLK